MVVANHATVPLTAEQRNWLRVNTILPTLFIIPIILVVGGALFFIYRRFPESLAVTVFTGAGALLLFIVSIFVGMHVSNNLRDLRGGVSNVAVARLLKKSESARSPKSFFAMFQGVGMVTVMHDIYSTLVEDRSYRVTYTPHTKRGWRVERML